MSNRFRKYLTAFLRVTIGLLLIVVAIIVYLVLNPGQMVPLLRSLPFPGVVNLPTPGPTPRPPAAAAPPGALPGGYMALWGEYTGGQFGCGFLLELPDGRQVGVSAAHATPALPAQQPAEFRQLNGEQAAALSGQIGRGHVFFQRDFNTDYVLWGLERVGEPQSVLKADYPRQVEPGEPVLVFSPFEASQNGSKSWPGVVMSVEPQAIFIQLADSLDPRGFSGCPVISGTTGRLIGMAIAGANSAPTVMGLHPVASLVEKAQGALPTP